MRKQNDVQRKLIGSLGQIATLEAIRNTLEEILRAMAVHRSGASKKSGVPKKTKTEKSTELL